MSDENAKTRLSALCLHVGTPLLFRDVNPHHTLPLLYAFVSMQVRLDIAYDGTNYVGWQFQPDLPTVQGVIEEALETLIGQPTRVMGASRTDTGVHALQQIAQFRTDAQIPADKYRLALLPFLPPDVVVTKSQPISDDYWILREVTSKTYRYIFHVANVANPLLSRSTWRVYPPVDVEAMKQAAAAIEGTHDFACFESSGSTRSDSIRTIYRSTLTVVDPWTPIAMPAATDAGGLFLVYEVCGSGFLYNMVRSIAGTLLAVGRGRLAPAEMTDIIAAKDRSLARETAPAHGLTLTQIRVRDDDIQHVNQAQDRTDV